MGWFFNTWFELNIIPVRYNKVWQGTFNKWNEIICIKRKFIQDTNWVIFFLSLFLKAVRVAATFPLLRNVVFFLPGYHWLRRSDDNQRNQQNNFVIFVGKPSKAVVFFGSEDFIMRFIYLNIKTWWTSLLCHVLIWKIQGCFCFLMVLFTVSLSSL